MSHTFINHGNGVSHISNVGNVNISFGCHPDKNAYLFKPIIWCGRQWANWAQLPKSNDCPMGKILQKIALLIPLVLATFAASLIGLVGLIASCGISKTVSGIPSTTETMIGSKKFIQRTFDLGSEPIHSIHLNSPGTLSIKPAEKSSLEIKVEDNLLKFLSQDLKKDKLTLGLSRLANIHSHGIYYVLKLAYPPSKLSISGSGDVQIDALNTDCFDCEISGSGDVMITSGAVTSQVIDISGSGDYRAPNLQSSLAKVNISGSGSAHVRVLRELSVKISGSGDCVYSGNPDKIHPRIEGSGELKSS